MAHRMGLSGVLVAAAIVLTPFVPVRAASASSVPQDALYVPGEVVVVFHGRGRLTSPLMRARALAGPVGGRVTRVSGSGVAVIKAAPDADVKELARRFASAAGVRFAEPNYIYRASGVTAGVSAVAEPSAYILRKATGTDLRVIVSKSALRAMTTRTGTGTRATYPSDRLLWDNGGWDWVGASIVWNNTTPSRNVCVIDTGVDYLHKDLATRVIKGWDCVNEDANPMDDNGHGTHVAGVIAARQNNLEGIAGVSPTAKVVAVKALKADGWGTNFDVAQAIRYCANRPDVSIINLSIGGPYSQLQEDAVNQATNVKGKLLVVSAGNESSDMPYCNDGAEDPAALTTSTEKLKSGVRSYPAGFAVESPKYDWNGVDGCAAAGGPPLHPGYPAVLSVGAGGSGSEFDYGCRAMYSNYGAWVNVTAPGTDILSTTPWDKPFTLNAEMGLAARYDYFSGTSMAAAFVAGTAARAWGYKPLLLNEAIAAYVRDTGTPISAEAGDPAEVCWPESMSAATDVNVAAALDRGGLVADAIDAVSGLPLIGATIQALQGAPLAVKSSAVVGSVVTIFPYDPAVYLSFPSSVDLVNLPASVITTLKVNKSGYTAAATNAFMGAESMSGNPDGTVETPWGGWLYAGYAAVPPKSPRFTAVSAWDPWEGRPAPTLTTSLPDTDGKLLPSPLNDGQMFDFIVGRDVCNDDQIEGETDGELSVFPNAQVVYRGWTDTHQIMTRVQPLLPALPQWTGDYVFRVYNPDLDFDTRQGSLFIWKDGIMKARVNMTDPGCDSTTDWWEAARLTSGKTGSAVITPLDTCKDSLAESIGFPMNCP